jgi:hypothetical protein
VVATDLSIADWMEVIRARDHEMPGRHRTSRLTDVDWMDDPTVFEELVFMLQVEYLKRARHRAYVPDN